MATRLFWLIGWFILSVPGLLRAASAPVELPEVEPLQQRCAAAQCSVEARVWLALARAGVWLAAYSGELRFDAAVTLTHIRRRVDSPALRQANDRARAVADRDHDHPHRRLWLPELVSPPEATSLWRVPASGEPRININYVVSEALHCDRNGWRPEVQAYLCGSMRDAGGYQTTHALWALVLARDHGCARTEAAEACQRALVDELVAAQPTELRPSRTLDLDLYGERLLTLLLAGDRHPRVASWAVALVQAQNADGSWGVGEDPDPYFRYHATGIAAWALAEWWVSLSPAERKQADFR